MVRAVVSWPAKNIVIDSSRSSDSLMGAPSSSRASISLVSRSFGMVPLARRSAMRPAM